MTTQQSKAKTQNDTFATLADLQSLRREIHQEMSGLRQDLASFQREITDTIARRGQTNWTVILTGVSIGLIVAGMAGALITSTIGNESTQRLMAVTTLERDNARDTMRIDKLLDRELENSYLRGEAHQKFATLRADLEAAIQNRKDIDQKHVASEENLAKRIDEVRHSLDNGLGRRISEMLSPITERLIALERVAFKDAPNQRDADRK